MILTCKMINNNRLFSSVRRVGIVNKDCLIDDSFLIERGGVTNRISFLSPKR